MPLQKETQSQLYSRSMLYDVNVINASCMVGLAAEAIFAYKWDA
jgi:hypothetical protein